VPGAGSRRNADAPQPRRTSAAQTGVLALVTLLVSESVFGLIRDGACQDAPPPGTTRVDVCNAVDSHGVSLVVHLVPVAIVLAVGLAQRSRARLYGAFGAVVVILVVGYEVVVNL
jgi:hypothetical protein